MCGEGLRCRSSGIPPFAKSAKDGAPNFGFLAMECRDSKDRGHATSYEMNSFEVFLLIREPVSFRCR